MARTSTQLSQLAKRGSGLFVESKRKRKPYFVEVRSREGKLLFDAACSLAHYAGACQRVGRCMRLALIVDGEWAGGSVLGSPFPNVLARDEAFGLTAFTRGYRERGLRSPWAAENHDYWSRLQLIANHARTFVLPTFQGRGVGVMALGMLRREGRDLWEARYETALAGFDTHCTSPTSRLFADNGWTLVGQTRGYTRDGKRQFSRRAESQEIAVKDNAGLSWRPSNVRWWTWVLPLRGVDDLLS
jgi:GNAT superfamily N-acetyltransferase